MLNFCLNLANHLHILSNNKIYCAYFQISNPEKKIKVIFYQKFSFFFWRNFFKTPIINIGMRTKCINRYESKQTEQRCKFELMIIHWQFSSSERNLSYWCLIVEPLSDPLLPQSPTYPSMDLTLWFYRRWW